MYLWTATGLKPMILKSTSLKIGAITVGQSPRVDHIPEIQPILGDSVEIIQAGALTDFQRKRSLKACSASW